MSFCQIFNMDIIPETATIASIIIIAKYFEMGFTMNGRPNNKRNQMTFRIMGFPDKGVMGAAGSIEIAERTGMDAIGLFIVQQHFLLVLHGISVLFPVVFKRKAKINCRPEYLSIRNFRNNLIWDMVFS